LRIGQIFYYETDKQRFKTGNHGTRINLTTTDTLILNGGYPSVWAKNAHTGHDLHIYEIKSAQTFHKEFFKSIEYLKVIFKERITRSALLFDGVSELPAQQNGVYNFRHFF
jgi:hypothetical protein